MSQASPRRLGEILERAEGFLRARGCDSARLDAGLLLAHVLHVPRIQIYLDHDRPLTVSEIDAYRALVRRRGGHEPVAYLTGQREFWSLPLTVDARVLIPRPDTETVVEAAKRRFCGTRDPDRFVDVGTGSGAIACALAREFPRACGFALDRDAPALAVASANVADLGLQDRIELRQGDLLEPIAGESVALICANLPYIPTPDLDALPVDVRRFEPRQALDGGPDGLHLIRALIACAPAHLEPDGALILEVGLGQAPAVSALAAEACFRDIQTLRDLAGVERVVVANRPEM